MDSQDALARARNKFECAAMCGRLATCTSVAFDPSQSTCYFHPKGSFDPSISSGDLVDVFRNESKYGPSIVSVELILIYLF